MPLVILAFILPVSWIAALVLLFAAPLIPIFMALIGWRAQAASERQLVATGGLNGFLLDRLRGLKRDLIVRKIRKQQRAGRW